MAKKKQQNSLSDALSLIHEHGGRVSMDDNRNVYAMGGKITPGGNNQTGASTYEGKTHEQGGIPIGKDIEVEGGEFKFNDMVFSNRVPNGKGTFADSAKSIHKKYSKRLNVHDGKAKKSAERELTSLFDQQELLKKTIMSEAMPQNNEEMGFGGIIKAAAGVIGGVMSSEGRKVEQREMGAQYEKAEFGFKGGVNQSVVEGHNQQVGQAAYDSTAGTHWASQVGGMMTSASGEVGGAAAGISDSAVPQTTVPGQMGYGGRMKMEDGGFLKINRDGSYPNFEGINNSLESQLDLSKNWDDMNLAEKQEYTRLNPGLGAMLQDEDDKLKAYSPVIQAPTVNKAPIVNTSLNQYANAAKAMNLTNEKYSGESNELVNSTYSDEPAFRTKSTPVQDNNNEQEVVEDDTFDVNDPNAEVDENGYPIDPNAKKEGERSWWDKTGITGTDVAAGAGLAINAIMNNKMTTKPSGNRRYMQSPLTDEADFRNAEAYNQIESSARSGERQLFNSGNMGAGALRANLMASNVNEMRAKSSVASADLDRNMSEDLRRKYANKEIEGRNIQEMIRADTADMADMAAYEDARRTNLNNTTQNYLGYVNQMGNRRTTENMPYGYGNDGWKGKR